MTFNSKALITAVAFWLVFAVVLRNHPFADRLLRAGVWTVIVAASIYGIAKMIKSRHMQPYSQEAFFSALQRRLFGSRLLDRFLSLVTGS